MGWRIVLAVLAALLGGAAPSPSLPVPTPNEIVESAAVAEWVDIAPADLLVMDLAPDANGAQRRVVIQLIPPPFSQGWVGNIRKLAAAHWWDGTSINRVQDNYVVQWGDADAEDKTKAKMLPTDLAKVPQEQYIRGDNPEPSYCGYHVCPPNRDYNSKNMRAYSVYAQSDTIWTGWPLALSGNAAWPVHCYGMVGVGRDLPPDTGTGAELYTVIGTPPRHLDRNIALVGRVIAGIEHLSSLPRGTGALGFYEKPEQRVPIVAVRLGNEVAGLAHYQYLSTEGATFARYADARANRRDAFFVQPAGGVDICNVPVPIRVRPSG